MGVGVPTSCFNLHFPFSLKGLDGDAFSEHQMPKWLPSPPSLLGLEFGVMSFLVKSLSLSQVF